MATSATEGATEVFRAGAEADSASEAVSNGLEAGSGLAARMRQSSGMMDRIIGAAFAFVIGIIMLNFLFSLDIVGNSSGPFADQLSTVQQVIGAAIVLAVLGILALAGFYARRMLDGGM